MVNKGLWLTMFFNALAIGLSLKWACSS